MAEASPAIVERLIAQTGADLEGLQQLRDEAHAMLAGPLTAEHRAEGEGVAAEFEQRCCLCRTLLDELDVVRDHHAEGDQESAGDAWRRAEEIMARLSEFGG